MLKLSREVAVRDQWRAWPGDRCRRGAGSGEPAGLESLPGARAFVPAATFTWWWNRSHTCVERRSDRAAHSEWLHWMGLMSVRALIDYGVYALLLMRFSSQYRWPALAAAVGSAIAALVNFSTARGMLFKRSGAAV